MNVTLTNAGTTFVIANGADRTVQVLGEDTLELRQQTQTFAPMRGAWIKAFPDRAVRSISLNYVVTFPPCDSLAAALWQSRQIPVSCPRGGVLVETEGSRQITYEAAWQSGPITAKRIGVTNQFHFSFEATNPSSATLSKLAMYDARYAANLSFITGLTGGGDINLDGMVTLDVPVGFLADIWVPVGGFTQPLRMRLLTDPNPGVTVTNTDPTVGTIIVLPVDYHATLNPKIWTV